MDNDTNHLKANGLKFTTNNNTNHLTNQMNPQTVKAKHQLTEEIATATLLGLLIINHILRTETIEKTIAYAIALAIISLITAALPIFTALTTDKLFEPTTQLGDSPTFKIPKWILYITVAITTCFNGTECHVTPLRVTGAIILTLYIIINIIGIRILDYKQPQLDYPFSKKWPT
jgi:hypothetical protein